MSTPGDPHGQWDATTQTAPPQPRNGMGTAALVLGILAVLSLLVVWIPFLGILTVVLGLIAIVLGAVGRSRVKKMQATNGGAAITGLVLGVLTFLIGVVLQVLAIAIGVAFLNSGGAESIQQYQQCITNAPNAGTPAQVQQAFDQCQQQFGQQLPQFGGDEEQGGG